MISREGQLQLEDTFRLLRKTYEKQHQDNFGVWVCHQRMAIPIQQFYLSCKQLSEKTNEIYSEDEILIEMEILKYKNQIIEMNKEIIELIIQQRTNKSARTISRILHKKSKLAHRQSRIDQLEEKKKYKNPIIQYLVQNISCISRQKGSATAPNYMFDIFEVYDNKYSYDQRTIRNIRPTPKNDGDYLIVHLIDKSGSQNKWMYVQITFSVQVQPSLRILEIIDVYQHQFRKGDVHPQIEKSDQAFSKVIYYPARQIVNQYLSADNFLHWRNRNGLHQNWGKTPQVAEQFKIRFLRFKIQKIDTYFPKSGPLIELDKCLEQTAQQLMKRMDQPSKNSEELKKQTQEFLGLAKIRQDRAYNDQTTYSYQPYYEGRKRNYLKQIFQLYHQALNEIHKNGCMDDDGRLAKKQKCNPINLNVQEFDCESVQKLVYLLDTYFSGEADQKPGNPEQFFNWSWVNSSQKILQFQLSIWVYDYEKGIPKKALICAIRIAAMKLGLNHIWNISRTRKRHSVEIQFMSSKTHKNSKIFADRLWQQKMEKIKGRY